MAARLMKVVVTMRRFGLSEREQQRVWELWGEGTSLRAVARKLGARPGYVRRYVVSTGGVKPALRRRPSGVCLSVSGRRSRVVWRGGRAVGRSGRGSGAATPRSRARFNRNGGRERYRAHHADAAAWRRARRLKPCELAINARLRAAVEEKLAQRWSPEQISGWLGHAYPDDLAMRVSHETIYLSLFVQSRGALRRELCAQLRSGRRTRRPRGRPVPQGRGQVRGMVMISERPAEVEDRAVLGHWEGDLLLGKRPSGIATLVERTTRFTQLVARRSLAWDQGKEMAEHARFTVDSGVQVYFCDPNSPWQRGSNENTNGLLRQYFSKRADLGGITQEQLDAVAAELNGRPRKTLGWITPADRFVELVANSPG